MKSVLELLPERKEECFLIKNAFSEEFCLNIIERFSKDFMQAKTHYPTSYRNNERCVVDDTTLSKKIFKKIQNYIPSKITIEDVNSKENGNWELNELNERIRICRYLPNQYFNKHLDGVHYRSKIKQSKLTFMIYLNNHDEFSGGKTLFFKSKEDKSIINNYNPIAGDLIVFDHNLWHAGEEVFSGEKYVLRSDIIYTKIKDKEIKKHSFCNEGHLGYVWTISEFQDKLITGGRDKKIKIWSGDGEIEHDFIGHDNSILKIIKQNAETIISCSRDGLIKLWKYKSGKFLLHKKLQPHKGSVLCLCKINEGEFLSGAADGIVKHININGNIINCNKAHNEWVWAITKIDEDLYATASEDGKVKIWTIKNHQLIAKWEDNIPINSICFSNYLFVGRLDGSIVKLKFNFNKKELELINKKKIHNGIVRVIKFYKNFIVSGSEDKKIKISKIENLEYIQEFEHKNFVQDLLIKEENIISVSYDGEINRNSITL